MATRRKDLDAAPTPKRSRRASRKTAGPVKRKPGRPVWWTVARKKAVFRLICAEVAGGRTIPRALAVLALRDPTRRLPTFTQMYEWLPEKQPAGAELAELLTRARETRAQYWAEQTHDIASDGENDTYIDQQGNVRVAHDVIARSKLRIETTEKILARHDPKRFGAKLDLTSGGEKLPPAVLLPAWLPIGAPTDPTPST